MHIPQALTSPWFRNTVYATAVAILLTFIPLAPIGLIGGLALLMALPGAQLTRWLGLSSRRWDFSTVTLSMALGMVTAPLLIYWSSLLFGFSRGVLLIVFPVYILLLAAWVSRRDGAGKEVEGSPGSSALHEASAT